MDSSPKCEILIVDDEEGAVAPIRNRFEAQGAVARISDPEDVTCQQVLKANVVLVDFQLQPWMREAESLKAQDEPIGKLPKDGLALASVLRRHVQEEENPPTAFVILTGRIEDLAGPVPGEYRNHALARINNLEWVFEKSSPDVVRQVMSLGQAVEQLPHTWSNEEGRSRINLLKLLGEEPADDEDVAVIEDVLRCLPPLHEISEWSHGITVLRWLLHRILPYPSFLLNTQYLAARLGLSDTSLAQEFKDTASPLRAGLAGCEYTGILRDFDGPRWWRSKIELFLWENLSGRASDLDAVRQFVTAKAQKDLAPSDPAHHPVVCIGEDYSAVPGFASIEDAVRLQPDDWPSYAANAWASMEQVREPGKLRSLVVDADRERLEL